MVNVSPTSQRAYTPSELLGTLNPVEERNAPPRLFTAGDPEILKAGPRVSIVGARVASPEGLRRAARLARLLVDQNITVVSGLARGIDTAAHRAALEGKGRTIAVIGTSLLEAYPRENQALQDRLMTEQLVISQFAPGVPTRKANFPQRNKTMALVADASVIIEAGDSSGSLSQGWEALRLGRPLFITRAVVEDRRLAWPAKMIEYGAQVLSNRNVDCIFEALPVWAREVSVDAHPF